VRLQSLGLDYYKSNYRFSFEKTINNKSIQESYKQAKNNSFVNVRELNDSLLDMEKSGDNSALLFTIEQQPQDLLEMYKKVANGKYFTFLQNNADGIIMGRNLEKTGASGDFIEDLGASFSGMSAKELSKGKMDRIIAIDTYNYAFQNVEIETEDDKVFTDIAQTVSIFINQTKHAYFISKDNSSENEDVYNFILEVIADIETYLEDGNSFSFVPDSSKELFTLSLNMMKENVNNYLSEEKSNGKPSFSWDSFA
jgi:hypothetical protein